jgi:hypothetical protein
MTFGWHWSERLPVEANDMLAQIRGKNENAVELPDVMPRIPTGSMAL